MTGSVRIIRRERQTTRTAVVVFVSVSLMAGCDVLGLGDEDCESDTSPSFTEMFTDLSQVRSIVPLGNPSTGGEIKERHQVQVLTDVDASGTTTGRSVPIIAAWSARLASVRHYRASSPPAPYADEYYGFVLEFSCEVTARFDHIRTPGEKLLAAAGSRLTTTFERPERETTFAAGEVIGHTDGNPPAPPGENRAFAFDYALYNSTHENVFVNTRRYRDTRNLANSLHAICGGSYYPASLRSEFDAALGYAGHTAHGDCRNASRDVAGAIAGGWFRAGSAPESDGWRLGIATEVDDVIRLAIHPHSSFFFSPVRSIGTVNLDPEFAAGREPWCYTDRVTEFWFRLSADGLRMSMLQRAGSCAGTAPGSYTVEWER